MYGAEEANGSLNLEELMGRPVGRTRVESEARKKERQRRYNEYRRVAMTALAKKYDAEYQELYHQAKAFVDGKRGPLPE